MPDVSYPIRMIRDVPVVVAPEEVDSSTAYGLRAALASAAPRQQVVVVDMTGTRSCDAVGLHVLVRSHKRALATCGELRLAVSSPGVLQLFAITGIGRVIPHFPSLDDALAHLTADADQPPRPGDAA